MSIEIHVFLRSASLPTVEEWNAAIKAEGFDLVIASFDLRKENGYRPAALKGEDSGFEWYLSPVAEAGTGENDLRASLCFGSRGDEWACASVAGAVLAKLSGGCYSDDESGTKLFRGEEAIADARKAFVEWEKRSTAPAKNIAAAVTSILAPALKQLGFVRVKPLTFARLTDGIVQDFSVHKRNEYFTVSFAGQALYPLRDFLAITFSPDRSVGNNREAKTPEHAAASMKIVVNQFLEFVCPWFEETNSTGGMLEYLLEFGTASHHCLFDISCLLAKLGRNEDAVGYLERAIFQYQQDARGWTPGYLALCRELQSAFETRAELDLLEKWSIQSLHKLGFKKLLDKPRDAKNGPPQLPEGGNQDGPAVPQIILQGGLRTAAGFSRDVVRPAVFAMMQQRMLDFQFVETRGNHCYFRRAGTAGLFDFMVFDRAWAGAMKVRLASNYDSGWRAIWHSKLGGYNGLANLRFGVPDSQIDGKHAAVRQSWYHYGRSEDELNIQIVLVSKHLAQFAPRFFANARKTLLARPSLQLGLRHVAANPLSDDEKFALERQLGSGDFQTPPANERFRELYDLLKRFAEERDVHVLTQQLLLANLSRDI